jgi:hypothetical protein
LILLEISKKMKSCEDLGNVLGVSLRERESRELERERVRLCGVVLVASLSRYYLVN